MDIKNEVIRFLESHNQIPGASETEKLSCYYLDSGVLDSMGIITLVTEFEDKFKIQFSNDDLQSQEFQTVSGLINIVNRLVTGRAP